jgi:D-sedoheptulose 7-phosphate isomerase
VSDPRDRNERFDASSIGAFLAGYRECLADALAAVDADALGKAAEAVMAAAAARARIYAVGNGGSAAIADHLCCDLTKGTDVQGHPPILSLSLVSNMPLYSAIANDLEFAGVFARQIDYFGRPGDVLIAISSSGASENIVRAASAAKGAGITVIGLTGFSGGKLRAIADIALHVPANNYGVVEDAHQSLMHVIAQFLTARRLEHAG